jgi:hypothetical protein
MKLVNRHEESMDGHGLDLNAKQTAAGLENWYRW